MEQASSCHCSQSLTLESNTWEQGRRVIHRYLHDSCYPDEYTKSDERRLWGVQHYSCMQWCLWVVLF